MSTKHRDLMNAAEELFAERGYGNTQISEIARVAGTGISTFYRYFENKEALLSVLVSELFDPLADQLRSRRAGIEGLSAMELLARIRLTFEVAIDALLARPRLTKILFTSGFGASPAVSESVRKELDSFAADLASDLERANESGLVNIPDCETFARGTIAVILHLTYDHIDTGKPDRETAIDISTRMTVGALMSFAPPSTQLLMVPMLRALAPGRGKPR